MSCPHCSGNHSDPMRRRFFSIVREANTHWPYDAEFTPDDAEHLRAWLLTKVGYRTAVEIPHRGIEPAAVAAIATAAIRASTKTSFIFSHNGKILVLTPKSIAKAKSKHKVLCQVFEAVEALVCETLGIESCDQLLKEKEQAA